jgi:hypothetical protein
LLASLQHGGRDPLLDPNSSGDEAIEDNGHQPWHGEDLDGHDPQPEEGPPDELLMAIKQLLLLITDLADLPPNPLDQLVDLCGGRGAVAEMTGRHSLLAKQDDGSYATVNRADVAEAQSKINLKARSVIISTVRLQYPRPLIVLGDGLLPSLNRISDGAEQTKSVLPEVFSKLPTS